MPQYIAADTGGTFTDVIVHDADSGAVCFAKTLTTYARLVDGVADGIGEADGDLAATEWLRHGTTHVINAFLQRRGAKAALIATEGFRDALEIRRGNRPAPFDPSLRRAPPLIPRSLRFEAAERIAADGSVVEPFDEAALLALVPILEAAEVEAIAISFLNAYANPVHEMRAVELMKQALPGVFVTSGAALSREWFEFERTSTAAANAYVGPSIATYVAGFADRLRNDGFGGDFAMMGSNGGVMPFEAAMQRPASLVESGPIGGVIGAAAYAVALDLPRLIAFDMGGTTAKCAVVEDHAFDVQPTYWVGGYVTGFPIRSPVLDIVEVGAGGGSVAWVDSQGRLHVGPESAGSEPGPACFGRGGQRATVTDANLLLGRIGQGGFLGGSLSLDADAAEAVIQREVARPMGYAETAKDIARVAHGVLDLATTLMTGAIKEITVARGRDVRDFTLMAFGGGGPIFGTELARQMGVRNVVVPPHPGNFSTIGMILAGGRLDVARSFVADLSSAGVAMMTAVQAELERDASEAARRELGGPPDSIRWQADMRYRGQRHSLTIDFEGAPTADLLKAVFETAYAERFGLVLCQDFAPEVIGLRAIAEGGGSGFDLKTLAPSTELRPPAAPKATRRFHLKSEGWREAPVWDRATLPVCFEITGPAIIEEYSATTLLGPDDAARVGELGELQIAIG